MEIKQSITMEVSTETKQRIEEVVDVARKAVEAFNRLSVVGEEATTAMIQFREAVGRIDINFDIGIK